MPSYSLDEVRQNEKLSVRNGAYAMVGQTIVGNFASLFVLQPLRGSSGDVAMLSSLPALMTIVATWAGAGWLGRSRSKRIFCSFATGAARILYLLIAFAPLLVHGSAAALLIVLLIALMNFPLALSALSWQSLIGDLIPSSRRAAFFSLRNRVMMIVSMAATVIPGIILQMFPVKSVPPYQFFFFAAFLFSVMEVLYLARHRENREHTPDRGARVALSPRMFAECLKRPAYRNFLIAAAVFNLGWQMAWPVYSIYQIRYAGATGIWISAFNVAAQISQILTFSRWGRASEKWGTRTMFGVACAGLALSPMATILSTNLVYLVFINLLAGGFTSGVTMLQFNGLLEAAPEEQRTAYIAHFNVALGIVGFVAPEIGVWLLSLIHMDFDMLLSSVLRGTGTILLVWPALARVRAAQANRRMHIGK